MAPSTLASRLISPIAFAGRSIGSLCGFALLLCSFAPSIIEAAVPQRPNIILVMADDQGYGDVGYNGHPKLKTPILDEMAATGLRFDRFYAAAPVCSPTRGSVMTGRHPNRFGCFSWGHTLRPQELTIAELLADAGYTSGHFGKWHLGSVRAESPVSPGHSGFDAWVSSPNFYENSPLLSDRGEVVATTGESSMVTVEVALPFIRAATAANKPFLAVIWFGNPHTPHQAVDELKGLYPGATKAEQNYYGEITGIDLAMGRLRDELRQLGIADETLLWYTSDNGAQGRTVGSTGGLRGVKASLWEGGIRVPAIIEWPTVITSPRHSDLPCTTSDILPTLVDLVGSPVSLPERPLDGISLKPLLMGDEQATRPGIGFWVHPTRGIGTPSGDLLKQLQAEQAGISPTTEEPPLTPTALLQQQYDPEERPGKAAWLDGSWKLHRIPGKGGAVNYELYDLAADPTESENIAKAHPERVTQMTGALEEWQRSVIGSLNGEDY